MIFCVQRYHTYWFTEWYFESIDSQGHISPYSCDPLVQVYELFIMIGIMSSIYTSYCSIELGYMTFWLFVAHLAHWHFWWYYTCYWASCFIYTMFECHRHSYLTYSNAIDIHVLLSTNVLVSIYIIHSTCHIFGYFKQ